MALAVLTRAYQDAAAAAETISDARGAYEAATALADALRTFSDQAADLRARTVGRIWGHGSISLSALAQQIGVSKARANQLVKSALAAGGEFGTIQPEAAFLAPGQERVLIATPLKSEAVKSRPVVAVEDVAAAQRLGDLARSVGLKVDFEHVPIGGEIDLNRSGLVVICGPRLSDKVASVLGTDPFLYFERAPDGPWTIRDRETGVTYRSGLDAGEETPRDVAYLGRLSRPDGNGSLIVMTGIHPQGTLGVVNVLTSRLGYLHDHIGTANFSVIIGVDFDASTHEPARTDLLSPLYRHGAKE